METLGVAGAQLLALFLTSTFWGFHVLAYFLCIKALLFDRDGLKPYHRMEMRMVSIASVFLILSCIDEALLVYAIISAFSGFIGPGGGEEALNQVSNVVPTTRSAVLLMVTMVADAMLIWRCWIIYSKRLLIVAFPIILWVACIALSFSALAFAQSGSGVADALVNAATTQLLITFFWISTINLNLLTTTMIVARLWKYERNNRRLGILNSVSALNSSSHGPRRFAPSSRRPSKTRDAVLTIIESGFLYTMTSSITFMTYITKSNGIYPMTGVLIQVSGIAFDLIIIRSAARSLAHVPARSLDDATSSSRAPFPHTQPTVNGRRSEVVVDMTTRTTSEPELEPDYRDSISLTNFPPKRSSYHVYDERSQGQKSIAIV